MLLLALLVQGCSRITDPRPAGAPDPPAPAAAAAVDGAADAGRSAGDPSRSYLPLVGVEPPPGSQELATPEGAPAAALPPAPPDAASPLPAAPADLADPPGTDSGPPDSDRAALLAQARGGFAAGVTGGLAGPDVWVTHLGNQGEGSLRAALETPGPAWVRFAVDGVIRLRKPIRVQSDKTLDGRGHRVEILQSGLLLDDVSNVVISNLILREGTDDALSVYKSRLILLDHLTLAQFDDGLIDITHRSTDVTVSWCRLEDHAKGMLVGSQDWTPEDADIRVTIHHSLFQDVRYRHPKMRFGYVHLYNSLVEHWVGEAIDVSHGGRILVERSQFVPRGDRERIFGLQVDPRDPPGFARAVDVDGGGLPLSASPEVEDPPYPYDAQPLTPALMQAVRDGSGWQP
jgi:pectate lyase